MGGLLYTVVVVLVLLWLAGFLLAHVGPLIHLVLVIAGIVLVYQLVTGRRAV